MNISDLLKVSCDDVKVPQPVPVGHYLMNYVRQEAGESSKKKTPYIEMHFTIAGPDENFGDVDMEEVKTTSENWNKKEYKYTFYLTEASLFMFKEFFEFAGIDTIGKNFEELLEELDTNGAQVPAYVFHEQGERMPFAKIKQFYGEE